MKYLIKKMLRDVQQNYTQFIAVFLMATISVMIYSGMASVWTGLSSTVKEEVDETNMANLYVSATNITDDDVSDIKDLEEDLEISLICKGSFNTVDGESEIEVNTVNNFDVSKFTFISGETYKEDKEGIYLDKDYAEKHNLNIGDDVYLLNAWGEEVTLTLLGTIHSPEYIYYTGAITETVPNYEKYGYGFVSNNTFLKLNSKINYTLAKITTSSEITDDMLSEILGERFVSVTKRADYTTYSRVEKEVEQMKKMATLFSLVFILLSLLTMYTSMVRLVNRQTQVIGTLKGLGVKSRQIKFHYALYGLITPLLGGLLGLLIGRLTVSKVLLNVKKTTLYLTEWKLVFSASSFILIAIIIICCSMAAVLAVRKVLKSETTDILRGNINQGRVKKELKDKYFLSNFSYEFRLAIRNMSENKVRFIMGIVGVLGGMVLMIAGLGVKDSINGSNDYVFSKQFTYEIKGILKIPGSVLEGEDGLQYLYENSVEIKTDLKDKKTILTALEDGNYYHFYDNDDNEINIKDAGVVVSRHLADELGIKAGDTISIKVNGDDSFKEIKVNAITKTLTPQGIFFSKDALEDAGIEFIPTSFLTDQKDAEYYRNLDEVKNCITREEQLNNTKTVADSVMSVVKLLLLASVMLSVVILYNLGILNYVERIRQYATMKVLGFYMKEIRSISISESIITTLIGWIFGMLIGGAFLKLYVKIISFDTFEWIAIVNLRTYIIATLVVVGVTLVVNILLNKKIKKIVMVEALKSVE
jgi:putative ABC transport system permease protein